MEDNTDCDLDDQFKYFPNQYEIKGEHKVSCPGNYIVCMSQSPKTDLVAAGLSIDQVALLKLETGQILDTKAIDLPNKAGLNSSVCGLKCSSQNDNELFICLSRGTILLYDVRTNAQIGTFSDNQSNIPTRYTSFDVNSNDRMICAGSADPKGEVWLSFFDVRQRQCSGGYFDCHESDISQVKFHESNPVLLLSGSTDGLINYYDVSESTEDDAFQCTFNTDRSVSFLSWHNDTTISCITDSNELIYYDLEDIEVIREFSRDTVTKKMHRKVAMDCNLINTFNGSTPNSTMLLATSYFKDGECLRTLTYDIGDKALEEHGNFSGNKQIVRCSLYNKESNYFLTGGEQSLINLWRPTESAQTIKEDAETNDNIGKVKSLKIGKSNKHKPY